MSDRSVNAPVQSPNVITAWVWYSGIDGVRKGEAFCYDVSTGTSTEYDGKRHNYVTRPEAVNAGAFAGVAARNYPPSGTGNLVEIYLPGSQGVEIALGADTVMNEGILTFQVGGGNGAAGRFVKAGFAGRGSAVPRQTVTALLGSSMTGTWSLAKDCVTLTVDATEGVSPGDTVILLGGKSQGSGKAIVAGRYAVKSVASGTELVLKTEASEVAPSAALTCTGYLFSANPTCQADLLEGEESGGVEFVTPPPTGGADVMSYMPTGVSYIVGGITVASTDANGPLADGVYLGVKKGFVCLGTITTKTAKVTLETAGVQRSVVAETGVPLALASASFDAAGEQIYLEWYGAWSEIVGSGATLAAS